MTTQGIPGNAPGRQRFYEPTPEEQAFERLCEGQLDPFNPQAIRDLAEKAPTETYRSELIKFADEMEKRLNNRSTLGGSNE